MSYTVHGLIIVECML